MLTAAVLFLAQSAAAAAPPETVPGPVAMTRTEIKAYNATLQRDHPSYIRCQRALETGSLVRKVTTCKTNAEWSRVEEIGNDDARRTVDTILTSGSTSSRP